MPMRNSFSESHYPITFRAKDAETLGKHLKLRHSVELVGIKRVGISNFLRFFLYHQDIVKKYIHPTEKHLFIAVDLNDLVETTLFPFWVLTFKRIIEAVEDARLPDGVKKDITAQFERSIQLKDTFSLIEGIRTAIIEIITNGYLPTLFFLRFDRIKDAVTSDFFANLQGLKDATGQKLAYVFTSFRALDEIVPQVFSRKALSVFSHIMYLKPATEKDREIIFNTFEGRYNLSLSPQVRKDIVVFSGGHVQYLQLSLIILHEKQANGSKLFDFLLEDERVNLQSEEIWESLTPEEQDFLTQVYQTGKVETEHEEAKYVFNTGLVMNEKETVKILNPFFENYLTKIHKEAKTNGKEVEFTKKEHALFNLLLKNKDQICERETIIHEVWPEYEELGVSDWTIDRLIARLRNKIKKMKEKYTILTVKTRGYKLVEGS